MRPAPVSLTLRPQRTIATAVSVEGYGFWSGQNVRLEFRPAAPNHGLVFVRSDLPNQPRIPALVAHRVEMPRRTTLSCGGVQVEMVEHVLAACAGLRIDNCEIVVDRAEMPGCDGSSGAFVAALLDSGIVEQSALRSQLVVTHQVRIGDAESWIEANPSRRAVLSLAYELDYGSASPIGRQRVQFEITPPVFERELSAARTFVLREEAEWLRSQGIGQRVTEKDLLVFGPDGVMGNQLRHPDECARHKALDAVGDLALSGCDIVGEVTAYRSGHRLNAEMARTLLAHGQLFSERLKSA